MDQWAHNKVFQMASVTENPSMFARLMHRLHGQMDIDVAIHHYGLYLHKPKFDHEGPWPQGWLRHLPFVKLLVQDAIAAYGLLSEAARENREVALLALHHKLHDNHLLAPPPLRQDEDFWLEALSKRLIDYPDLPIELQWDVPFMVRVLRGPPLRLHASLRAPKLWPYLDSEELLMELMWACSDSDFDFWRYVQPQQLFGRPRSLQLWTVAVRTTSCSARMSQIATFMGPSEKAFIQSHLLEKTTLSQLASVWILDCAVMPGLADCLEERWARYAMPALRPIFRKQWLAKQVDLMSLSQLLASSCGHWPQLLSPDSGCSVV